MEAERTRKRWTYAEFARLPTSGSTRYEVIDRELVVTPGPTGRHQWIAAKLIHRLVGFAEAHDCGDVFAGPLDVLFGEGDYFEPDILFVRRGRADVVTQRGVEGPPDLVVEILSPSTAARDRGIKLERYRLFGVPEYWIIDPDGGTIEVWRLAGRANEPVVYGPADTLRWMPAPGDATLEIPVAELFGPV